MSTSWATAVSRTVLPTTPETRTLLPVLLSKKANETRGPSSAGGVPERVEKEDDDEEVAATAVVRARVAMVTAARRVSASMWDCVMRLAPRFRRPVGAAAC